MSKTNSAEVGISFNTALFLLFLGLKLGHVISWSWWWIFAPFWIPVLVVLAILAVIVLGALVMKVLDI